MRDLKRANALMPAYKLLAEAGFEVFTPMKWEVTVCNGKRRRVETPFVRDLLFVNSTRVALDGVVAATPTLQYRYVKGAAYCTPMVVRRADMTRFMHAVRSTDKPVFYLPDELTPDMYGRRIMVVGSALDSYEGRLLAIRGGRKKRLIVELPGMLKAAVEVNPDYIRFVD